MRFRLLLVGAVFCAHAIAGTAPSVTRDLPYVTNGHPRQKLDLYLPAAGESRPLVVWIHGGAWKGGDKGQNPAMPLVQRGFAVASINYRLSQEAHFPAQLEDCKAAIRWLRAHAADYRINRDRFAAWGISAGGHLAALLGTTGDEDAFDKGENAGTSSRVQCVVDWAGPTDFEELGKTYTAAERDAPDSPITQLLGGPIPQRLELARLASPIRHIRPGAPPFLIMHGERDTLV